ncbi:MAG TPA: nucleotidyltransferase domain-containing protein [Thermoanaerobaculia bacterium]|nr:nucleotidyltransferase domain-containing protein [Thermoanaerobaculia bacterium]
MGAEAEKIEERLRSFLSARAEAEGLAAAYLFGSVARGTARPESDIDVGVLYRDDPPASLEGLPVRLEADLAKLLHRPVQVVVLNRAPVDLVQRVLQHGKLLLDRDSFRRIRFEVRTRQEFWDLEPYLRQYRRMGGGDRDRS